MTWRWVLEPLRLRLAGERADSGRPPLRVGADLRVGPPVLLPEHGANCCSTYESRCKAQVPMGASTYAAARHARLPRAFAPNWRP